MKVRKIHLKDKSHPAFAGEQKTICGVRVYENVVVTDLAKVSCKNCLKLAGETTEQGGPKDGDPTKFDVVVLKTGGRFIDVIKTIRQLLGEVEGIPVSNFSELISHSGSGNYFGLKESKDFADAVRYSGPQTLVTQVSKAQAEAIKESLSRVGAEVELRDGFDRALDRVSSITQAYNEMLALFLPEEKYITVLDDLDDDDKSGRRPWPMVAKAPTIADVRRWLAAGGTQS